MRRQLAALALLLLPASTAIAAERLIDLTIVHGKLTGGQDTIRVQQNDSVVLRWHSDRPIGLHLHGYEIETRVVPGTVAEMRFGVFAAASLLQASAAAAHGFGQRYDLPLPLWLYLFGAAAAVVVSFIIVGLFVRGGASRTGVDRRFDLMPHGIGRLILHPAFGLVLKLIVFAIFAVTVVSGFIGNQDPYRNLYCSSSRGSSSSIRAPPSPAISRGSQRSIRC
jgi:hypothetical protein